MWSMLHVCLGRRATGRTIAACASTAALLRNGSSFDFDPEAVSHWSQWLGHQRPRLLVVGWDFSGADYFVLHNLMAHPELTVAIVRNTMLQSGTYASEFIGRLAWNDQPLPAAYLLLAGGVLGLAALAGMAGEVRRPAYTWLAVGFAVGTIMVLQYLDWTPPGRDRAEGVVGRYFITLFLILSLALPSIERWAPARRYASCVGLIILALVTPAVMAHHVVLRFYIN
jgi:hypothetical protein